MSENVENLCNRKLSKAEVSLLSKGLKFCPTPNSIDVDKSVLKEDLEKLCITLRLKWHYRNDERTFDPNPFDLNLNLILVKLVQSLNYTLVILKRNVFPALKLNIRITI